jgi:hypothetical protein
MNTLLPVYVFSIWKLKLPEMNNQAEKLNPIMPRHRAMMIATR